MGSDALVVCKLCGVPWSSSLVHQLCVLCSDGRYVGSKSWLPVSLSKTLYHYCFSPPRSKWVPVWADLVVVHVFDKLYVPKMAAVELYTPQGPDEQG